MDIQTSHLLSKLDRLIDIQRDHGEVLHRILAEVTRQSDPSNPSRAKRIPLSGPVARGAVMWMLGAAIVSYLVRGGDPVVLIELLLRSFG
jgi:hypothetical protein